MDAYGRSLESFLASGNLAWLQELLFGQAQLTSLFVDAHGHLLEEHSAREGFCGAFSGNDETEHICRNHVFELFLENKRTGRVAVVACPNTGLMSAGIPLFWGELYLGSWVVAQVRVDGPDSATVAGLAEEWGRTPAAVQKQLDVLPLFAQEEFARLVHVLEQVAKTLFELEAPIHALHGKLDFSGVGMYVCDYETGKILGANDAFSAIAGRPRKALAGVGCGEAGGMSEGGFCHFCPRKKLLDADGVPDGAQTWRYYNSRMGRWTRCTCRAVRWLNGRMACLATQVDASGADDPEGELAHLAYYDRLLSLPNGMKLIKDLELLEQGRATCYLLCVAIDSMRPLNSVYGRATGDELLRAVARWLHKGPHDGGVYRIQDDAFGVLLPDIGRAAAETYAGQVHTRFSSAWKLRVEGEEITYYCDASVSLICLYPGLDLDSIENVIDRTLAFSQTDRVTVYDAQEDERIKQEMQLALELKHCARQGMQGFSVCYQPIVELASGAWRGVEALCRWTSPSGAAVHPEVFIHEAEQNGLIHMIGDWVLKTAVCQCKQMGLDELDDFFLSVNVSPLQMMKEGFTERLLALLAQQGYPGGKLVLEITESARFALTGFVRAEMETLQSNGIRIALDDFGTGYSSFDHLKMLPVDFLKTEQAFIHGVEDDEYLQYFYFFMSELSHANGMKLIAEGIETDGQLEVMRSNGADYIQGFYSARPLPAEELAQRLACFSNAAPPPGGQSRMPLNMEKWMQSKSAHAVAPGLFRLLNQCVQTLLTQEVDDGIRSVLRRIGEHFHAGHVFAVLANPPAGRPLVHEWAAPRRGPLFENMTKKKWKQLAKYVREPLRSDGVFLLESAGAHKHEIAALLGVEGELSMVMLPMWKGKELAGMVGLGDTVRRECQPEELIMLWNLGMIVQGAVHNAELEEEVVQKSRLLREVLDSAAMNAFIADPETAEILWVNQTLRNNYSIGQNMVGRKCYAVLRGRSKRCPGCKVNELLLSGGHEVVSYETYNDYWDRSFLVYDSIVNWENGKKVHIEYSVDITENKKRDQRIEELSRELLVQR